VTGPVSGHTIGVDSLGAWKRLFDDIQARLIRRLRKNKSTCLLHQSSLVNQCLFGQRNHSALQQKRAVAKEETVGLASSGADGGVANAAGDTESD